jgi:hypothetical protein
MYDYRLKTLFEKSHQLTLSVCRMTACFPASASGFLVNRVELTSASISEVMASVYSLPDDSGRDVYLEAATRLLVKLRYLLLLVRDLGYLAGDEYDRLLGLIEDLQYALTDALWRYAYSEE